MIKSQTQTMYEFFSRKITQFVLSIKDINYNLIILLNIKMDDLNTKFSTLEYDWELIVKKLSNNELEELLNKLDDYYYNGEAIISDEIYEKILDYYVKITGKSRTKFGHVNTVVHGTKIKLPLHMGSMSKVKPGSSELNSYLSTYTNNKCIMDKLDGTSLLCDFSNIQSPKAYTRGNGTYGHDVSRLIPYIRGINNSEQYKIDGFVRGELIVSKQDWEKIKHRGANARNFVSGVINRKNIDKDDLKYVQFIAYEFYCGHPITILEQLDQLELHKFTVVTHYTYENENLADALPSILKYYKEESKYEIDGIIIQDIGCYNRNTSGNPKYAKAFKMDSICDSAIIQISNIIWEPSKNGSLKPIVIIPPTNLSGVIIQRITAYNASFVEKNKLGKGAIIEIIRSGDVIPKIINVVKSSDITWPEEEYIWDNNHTDIFILNKSDSKEVNIRQIEHFIKVAGISFFKIGQIKKAYEVGVIKSCDDLIKITKEDLLKIDGLKDKSASKIINSFNENCNNIPIYTLAAATPYFPGLGSRRIEEISKNINNFMDLELDELKTRIVKLDGFSNKTTELFIGGLINFRKFYDMYIKRYKVKLNEPLSEEIPLINDVNSLYYNKKFVFTGFRDKNIEKHILENGGEVKDKITNKNGITHLVVKELLSKSSKVKSAEEMGIEIITRDYFKNKI